MKMFLILFSVFTKITLLPENARAFLFYHFSSGDGIRGTFCRKTSLSTDTLCFRNSKNRAFGTGRILFRWTSFSDDGHFRAERMPIVRASRLDREPLISESQDALGRDFAFFRRKIYFLSKEKDVFFEGKRSFLVERWAWRPLVGAQIKGRFSILAYEPVDC